MGVGLRNKERLERLERRILHKGKRTIYNKRNVKNCNLNVKFSQSVICHLDID